MQFFVDDLFPTWHLIASYNMRIVIYILQSHCFRTDMSFADRVLLVTPDRFNLPVFELDLETTDRLAKVAGYITGLHHMHGLHDVNSVLIESAPTGHR